MHTFSFLKSKPNPTHCVSQVSLSLSLSTSPCSLTNGVWVTQRAQIIYGHSLQSGLLACCNTGTLSLWPCGVQATRTTNLDVTTMFLILGLNSGEQKSVARQSILVEAYVYVPGLPFLQQPLSVKNTTFLWHLQKQSSSQLGFQDLAPSLLAFIQLRTAFVQTWSGSTAVYAHLYYQDPEPPIKVTGRARCWSLICHRKMCLRDYTEN